MENYYKFIFILFLGALLNETDFSSLLWTDLANWITVGYEDNVAVPHMERLPCQYDDISFPAGLESRAVNFFGYNVKIKSFKFANEYWNNEDLAHYLTQQVTSGKYCKLESLYKLSQFYSENFKLRKIL